MTRSPGAVYAEGRHRLTAIVRGIDEAEAATMVPACPQWTVRDVIAHLAGSCADVLAGKVDGVTTATWADAQVRQRQDRTVADLLEEWSLAAPPLEAASGGFPAPLPTLWILDLTTHEHDVRGALRQPGARDAEAVLMAVDFLVREGLGPQLQARALGPLAVRTAVMSWVVGAHGKPPVGSVDASLFDLFRALTGRRSRTQIAAFDWSVDPGRYLSAFEFGTFTTRTADLEE